MTILLRRLSLLTIGLFAVAGVSLGAIVSYDATLSGPAEFPPNASPGIGTAHVDIDVVAHTLHVHADFSGLLGTTTASHIHAPTLVAGTGAAGVATMTPYFAGFPIGVTSGTFDGTFDTSLTATYNSPFVTGNGGTAAGAEAALAASMAAGTAYLNIHSTVVPGGEIRGFLTPVPEPATVSSLLIGAALLRRRR
jgi:hypothetical protein